MCGICGIVAFDRPPETEAARAMSRLLAHRGPDGDGAYDDPQGVALGHRRLAIIDLSDAGLQPFASADGTLRLVYNGEIYNYVELRDELEQLGHHFRTRTDTEVVLESYRRWGDRCTSRFNGMWAFAIWDAKRRALFCSRDRFGIKPLYYRYANNRFVFASELKAFAGDPGHALAPNLRAVRDFVEQGYVDHTAETFFDGICQLLPGHNLLVERSGIEVAQYWSLEPSNAPADPVGEFRELLLDAVRLNLRSDVRIGTALSGGLDSSSVACAIARLLTSGTGREAVGSQLQTFTVYFDDPALDERPFAEAVTRQIDADAHWLTFGGDELAEVLPQVVRAQDEPFGSPSIVAQWFVMSAAREHGVKVMLDGQGADEALLGYGTTYGYRLADLAAGRRFDRFAREAGAIRGSGELGTSALAAATITPFLPADVRWRLRARRDRSTSLVHPSLRRMTPTRERTQSPFAERLRRQYHLILSERGLPELLRYEDRNSMAHSLESRVPFLDHRLVELAYAVPTAELYDAATTKLILRRAFDDILPPQVRDRRDKLGFATPGVRLFRSGFGDYAQRVLSSPRVEDRGFVDGATARERLGAVRSGRATVDPALWRAFILELWAQTYLD